MVVKCFEVQIFCILLVTKCSTQLNHYHQSLLKMGIDHKRNLRKMTLLVYFLLTSCIFTTIKFKYVYSKLLIYYLLNIICKTYEMALPTMLVKLPPYNFCCSLAFSFCIITDLCSKSNFNFSCTIKLTFSTGQFINTHTHAHICSFPCRS